MPPSLNETFPTKARAGQKPLENSDDACPGERVVSGGCGRCPGLDVSPATRTESGRPGSGRSDRRRKPQRSEAPSDMRGDVVRA